ncbi:PulJ/GspJ family protein [Geminicoccus harenae]|uniref:PulJ/GspJ family protein n=1 Tax=Geminicoccus harenae TaxID=2498453 RepID=UPI00168A6B52|nr:prepilin-type N-terminal cleavage/methylation domain-containing protein [Geminicoccus harenae]
MRAEPAIAGGPPGRSGDAGFTILEVLVALTVLALVVAVLFEGIASGLRRTSYDEGRLALVLEAERILQRIDLDLAKPLPLQTGVEGELRWRLDRQRIQDLPARPPALGDDPEEDEPQEGQLELVRYVVTVEGPDGRQLSVQTKRLRTVPQPVSRPGSGFGDDADDDAGGFGEGGSSFGDDDGGFGDGGFGGGGFGGDDASP